jgi:hypothetical protein
MVNSSLAAWLLYDYQDKHRAFYRLQELEGERWWDEEDLDYNNDTEAFGGWASPGRCCGLRTFAPRAVLSCGHRTCVHVQSTKRSGAASSPRS